MLTPALTLQLPSRSRVIPIATTTSPELITQFCAGVCEDYSARVMRARDDVEVAIYRAELERLRCVFELLGFGSAQGPT